jgi:hypothetical protein
LIDFLIKLAGEKGLIKVKIKEIKKCYALIIANEYEGINRLPNVAESC